ncbi:serine hydrolase domain-containing protein [Euzebyella saccharophila]|uniref:Serine hydrolase domain-containing protein n=1 Tax=Euzebyella saccharophila TaxID=679664 RepID=A0ABV8JIM6_9FLAO|nr:serine hydrolase domain-containing protein [Euzebyella saccharophila]
MRKLVETVYRTEGIMIKIAIVLITLFLNALAVVAQADGDLRTKIEELTQKLYEEGKLHGALLVAEGEEIIYEGAFGFADRNLKIPNSPHMRFWNASIGKMFTAVLILQLVEEGKLQLNDPISKHLTWFKHPESDKITIHDLLAHRSGFKSTVYEERDKAEHNEKSQRSILEHKISKVDLAFEPGTAFLYSNTGYVLLSEIIMGNWGTDYNKILQERLFIPLGMKQTYWSEAVYGPNTPVLYLQDGNAYLALHDRDFTGAGGEKTTLRDMHKFMLAAGTNQLLSQESWNLAFTPHSLPSEAKSDWGPHQSPYGYGFSLIDLPYSPNQTAKTISHGGAGKGTSSYALRFLKENRIVILWNNEFKDPMLFELYLALSEGNSKK